MARRRAPTACCAAASVLKSSTAEESRQPRHRAAAGNQAGTHLPLRKEGLFTARKAHVARESEFAANAR